MTKTQDAINTLCDRLELITAAPYLTTIGTNVYWEKATPVEYGINTVIVSSTTDILQENQRFKHKINVAIDVFEFGISDIISKRAIGLHLENCKDDILKAIGVYGNASLNQSATYTEISVTTPVIELEGKPLSKLCIELVIWLITDKWNS